MNSSKTTPFKTSLIAALLFLVEAFMMLVLLSVLKDLAVLLPPVHPDNTSMTAWLSHSSIFYFAAIFLVVIWISTWILAKRTTWLDQRVLLHLPLVGLEFTLLAVITSVVFSPVIQS